MTARDDAGELALTTMEDLTTRSGASSFMIWQSRLRGVGVYTGCTRCYDLCPVGADYDAHLREVQERIPEETPARRERLAGLAGPDARARAAGLRAHACWIGDLPG